MRKPRIGTKSLVVMIISNASVVTKSLDIPIMQVITMYAVILYSTLTGDDAVLTFQSSDAARLFCAEYAQGAGYMHAQHCRDSGNTLRIVRICEPCDLISPPLYYHSDPNGSGTN